MVLPFRVSVEAASAHPPEGETQTRSEADGTIGCDSKLVKTVTNTRGVPFSSPVPLPYIKWFGPTLAAENTQTRKSEDVSHNGQPFFCLLHTHARRSIFVLLFRLQLVPSRQKSQPFPGTAVPAT